MLTYYLKSLADFIGLTVHPIILTYYLKIITYYLKIGLIISRFQFIINGPPYYLVISYYYIMKKCLKMWIIDNCRMYILGLFFSSEELVRSLKATIRFINGT